MTLSGPSGRHIPSMGRGTCRLQAQARVYQTDNRRLPRITSVRRKRVRSMPIYKNRRAIRFLQEEHFAPKPMDFHIYPSAELILLLVHRGSVDSNTPGPKRNDVAHLAIWPALSDEERVPLRRRRTCRQIPINSLRKTFPWQEYRGVKLDRC